MGTTALFAELVVVGVLTLTWMILVAMTALGPSRFAPLLEIPPTLSAGILLAIAYALGVVFDRVWDFILDVSGFQTWIRDKPRPATTKAPTQLSEWEQKRRRVFGADATTAADFVNYHRSRMRVARASLFNFILIAASGLALLAVRFGGAGTDEFALAAGTGGILCVASALALWNLGRSHDRVLEIVHVEVVAVPTSPPNDSGTAPGLSAGEAVREKTQ